MQTTTSGVAGPPERRTPAQWLFVACGAWLIGPFTLHPLALLFALSGTLMISKTLRIPKL